MSDGFFLDSSSKRAQKLRKRADDDADGGDAVRAKKAKAPAQKRARKAREEEEDGTDDIDPTSRLDGVTGGPTEETADEKRVRLAKQYLERVRDEAGSEASDEEIEGILQKNAVEESGRARIMLAGKLKTVDQSRFVRGTRAHKLSATCVAVSEDGRVAFSGSKDGTVCKWDPETGKCLAVYAAGERFNTKGQKHKSQVLAISLSSDGKLLVSGGEDRAVHVWDVTADKKVDQMAGHRDTVTALAFRQDSHQFYSGSMDRTVKVWNADSMSYVETLFGHQSPVMALDALLRERALSCGADNTLRVWKLIEETQLVFRGHTASIDCATLVNEALFLAGSQDGAITAWSPSKKKAACTHASAHGGQWISSLSACRRSDLAASGSCDGFIRLWNVRYGTCLRPGDSAMGLSEIDQIPMEGYVNGMAFAQRGRLLVAGVGQEHRLGRWQRITSARNGVVFVPLEYDD
eukprot:m51a1_g2734 hypothetical protein (463) ;mRNA; f:896176-898124